MRAYQRRLADLLWRTAAFRVGRFTLKSGAASPYFINFGRVSDGAGLKTLGEVFAAALLEQLREDDFDVVVGPAYKGITLAVALAMVLAEKGQVKGVVFNRKELKGHGEDAGKTWIAGDFAPGARAVIVDDVFTNGGAKAAVLEELKKEGVGVVPRALLVGVDRQQHPKQGGELFADFCSRHQLKGIAVLTVEQLVDHLSEQRALSASDSKKIRQYVHEGILADG
jgi:orotate phosphoribosyltransferase